jgi:hypothetical protein
MQIKSEHVSNHRAQSVPAVLKKMRRVVTMDKTWVHFFDPKTKQQSMEWKHRSSPRPKKFRVQKSAGKVLASVFWNIRGVIMIDYREKGLTITGTYSYYVLLITNHPTRENQGKKTRHVTERCVVFAS